MTKNKAGKNCLILPLIFHGLIISKQVFKYLANAIIREFRVRNLTCVFNFLACRFTVTSERIL